MIYRALKLQPAPFLRKKSVVLKIDPGETRSVGIVKDTGWELQSGLKYTPILTLRYKNFGLTFHEKILPLPLIKKNMFLKDEQIQNKTNPLVGV